MTRKEILQLLYSSGKRPSTLARVLGVSRPAVTQALDGKGSRRIRLKIASTLKLTPSLIWDDAPRSQKILDDDEFYNPHYYEVS